jgi:hypothetical protein
VNGSISGSNGSFGASNGASSFSALGRAPSRAYDDPHNSNTSNSPGKFQHSHSLGDQVAVLITIDREFKDF